MSAPTYERREACICGTPPAAHPQAELLEDEPAITLDDVLRAEGLPPLGALLPPDPVNPLERFAIGVLVRQHAHHPQAQRRFTPHRQIERDADGLITDAELDRLRREQRRRGSPYIGRHATRRYVVRSLDREGGYA